MSGPRSLKQHVLGIMGALAVLTGTHLVVFSGLLYADCYEENDCQDCYSVWSDFYNENENCYFAGCDSSDGTCTYNCWLEEDPCSGGGGGAPQ